MNLARIIFVFIIFSGIVFSSCQKFEEYPEIPDISFAGFVVIRDAQGKDSLGLLNISYTDGDGDIGLTKNDTLPPYKYNYFLDIYQRVDDTLRKIILPDTNVNFNGRIPVLTPDGDHKAIKGNIEMELELFMMIPFLDSDTVAFEIYIMDRALHKSNTVRSPQYILN